jgi:putative transposase
MATFVEGYNHTHHHAGIGLKTPADVHFGLAEAKAKAQHWSTILADARNPERLSTHQDPQILAIPTTAWINQPAERTEQQLVAKLPLASFTLTNSGELGYH